MPQPPEQHQRPAQSRGVLCNICVVRGEPQPGGGLCCSLSRLSQPHHHHSPDLILFTSLFFSSHEQKLKLCCQPRKATWSWCLLQHSSCLTCPFGPVFLAWFVHPETRGHPEDWQSSQRALPRGLVNILTLIKYKYLAIATQINGWEDTGHVSNHT